MACRPRRTRNPIPILLVTEPWVCGCDPPSTPARRPPPAPIVTAPDSAQTPENTVDGRRCALSADPPEDLTLGEGRSRAAVAWNGTHFGVVWTETREGEDRVMFVRVGADGARLGSPVQVSERGYRAVTPSLAWNGASWSVVYVGGINALGDLFQARVDPRGIPAGRPWRITRGDRDDAEPVLVGSGPGYGLAWVATEFDRRHTLYTQAFRSWDAREVPPTRVLNTSVGLSAPRLVWTGSAWAVLVLAAQRDAIGVDMARVESDGRLRASARRVTPGQLGGAEFDRRYAVAWDGAHFAVAWSEQRDGRTAVHLVRADLRGDRIGDEQTLSDPDASGSVPALESIGDAEVVAAYEHEREGVSRVRLRALGADGWIQPGHVELQGVDGRAGSPAMVWSAAALGVVTTTPRGITFHRVSVGPCAALARPP